MQKFFIVVLSAFLGLAAQESIATGNGQIHSQPGPSFWSCGPIGVSVNPTFIVEVFNGALSRRVRNTTEADPFFANAKMLASDRAIYEFPEEVQKRTGHISLTIKRLGVKAPECEGRQATFQFINSAGQQWAVPYCCRDI